MSHLALSPLSQSSVISPAMTSTSIESTPTNSPSQARRGDKWMTAAGGTLPKRLPSTLSSPETSTKGRSPILARNIPNSGAAGAEGGSAAIGERRRESNSFKTLTTGSLVSNSPWTKSLGRASSPVAPIPTRLGGGPSTARGGALGGKGLGQRNGGFPDLTRKVSGGKKVDDPAPTEVKENVGGQVRIPSGGEGDFPKNAVPRLSSPSTPFRPIRQAASSPAVSTSPIAQFSNNLQPFKPSRTVPQESSRPRQSLAYVSAELSRQVTSSPFIALLGSSSAVPPPNASPPLQQTPDDGADEIENPPSLEEPEYSPSSFMASPHEHPKTAKLTETVGLGIRPGGPTPLERRIAGSSAPPPSTPPQEERTPTSSTSPASALATTRRGMTGPRPLSIIDHFEDGFNSLDIDQLEKDEGGMTLRRKPSTKTVTWATTEEVLEFDAEEERRVSGASQLSSSSSSASMEESTEDEEEEETSIDWQIGDRIGDGDGSLGFDEENSSFLVEGGSVIERAVEESYESETSEHTVERRSPIQQADDETTGSAVSSSVEEMIDQIDAFIADDVFSPSLVTDDHYGERAKQLALDHEQELSTFATSLRAAPSPFSSPQPGQDLRLRSAFSVSSTGAMSDDDDDGTDAVTPSESSFEQDEDEILTPAPSSPLVPVSLHVPTVEYALPDLPENSPFVGFEDDGKADSVVTLDLEQTSTPTRDLDATPTKARPQFHSTHISTDAPSNPFVSSLSSLSCSPPVQHLSRQASIVDPESAHLASSVASSLDSLRGSLRGGRLRKGKEQFLENQERFLRAHEFQSPPLGSMVEEGPPVAIHARPAVKASSATLSSSMLPAIEQNISAREHLQVGTVLTAEVAQGMESPLDRLQRGVGGDAYAKRNSVLEVEEEEMEEIDDVEEMKVKVLKGGARGREGVRSTSGRRRSRSTGDVSDTRVASSSASLLSLPVSDGSFGRSLETSFGNVIDASKRNYKIHEKGTIYADDGSSSRGSFASDDGPGKAWRKKRPSNVHDRLSVPDLKALKDSRDGQLFAKIISANLVNVPIPSSQPTLVEMSLANRQVKCKAGSFNLSKDMLIKKEFELSSGPLLTFQVILSVPIDSRNPHLLPPPPAPIESCFPTPSSPTKAKSPGRLRSVFSSPKKNPPPPPAPVYRPPVPERILPYLASDGTLAIAKVEFKTHAHDCRLKTARVTIPFESPTDAGSRPMMATQGYLTLDLFHVPSVPGFSTKADKERLPKSAEEARVGIELAAALRVTQEGVLTQLGGDCSTWKRRLFKLRGTSLLPYSEITKRALVEVDLSLATSVVDLSLVSAGQQALDGDEPLWTQANMFRVVFVDGTDVSLFADSAAEKDAWLTALNQVVGKSIRCPPEWARILQSLEV